MISIAHTYLDELSSVSQKDVNSILEKDKAYGGSWKRRGGVGAAMMLLRKSDRLEQSLEKYNWDIFKAIEEDNRDESILDDIRDLRCYLLLVESEIQARRTMADRARAVDNYRAPVGQSIEITGVGQPIIRVAPARWGTPDPVLPSIEFLHTPTSNVTRTEPVAVSSLKRRDVSEFLPDRPRFRTPNRSSLATACSSVPGSGTTRPESQPHSASELAEMFTVKDCPCGDTNRPNHPSTWCIQESKGDA